MTQSWAFGPHLNGFHNVGTQLLAQLHRRTKHQLALSHARNDRITTPDDLAERQAEIRAAVLAGVGGLPDAEAGPPPYEEVGRIDRDGFVLHKLIIETAPGVYAPALLSIPTGLSGPTGAVLFSCGHAENGKASALYQSACARFARNGLVTLVLDPIGQGERWSYLAPDGTVQVACNTHEHSYAGAQCWWLGDSITRWFVHDARRAIDLLVSLPEVDPQRIAAVGNSGGGTLTTWLMALEPRLAAAVPSCFVSFRTAILRSGIAQDAEQHLLGVAANGIDHEDLVIAMAPRPVLVSSANHDFFPIDGTVRTVARARRAYDLLGAGDQLQHVRVDDRHGFGHDLAIAATRFLVERFLPGRTVDDTDPDVLSDAEVQCTATGQVRLDRPESRTVFDLNLARYGQLTATATTDPAARRAWLAERVLGPRDVPAELFPRWFAPRTEDGVTIRQVCWSSEADLLGSGVLVTGTQPPTAVEIVLLDHGTSDIDAHRDALLTAARAGVASLVVDVRGSGSLLPDPVNPRPVDADYGTLFLILTGLLWLGDSLAAGQVFDVLRAAELARVDPIIGLGDGELRIRGEGAGAFLAQLACELDPTLGEPVLTGTTIVPHAVLTQRLHGDDRSWLSVLPGLPVTRPAVPAPAG